MHKGAREAKESEALRRIVHGAPGRSHLGSPQLSTADVYLLTDSTEVRSAYIQYVQSVLLRSINITTNPVFFEILKFTTEFLFVPEKKNFKPGVYIFSFFLVFFSYKICFFK